MAYIGKSPTGTGVRQRYYFTATGGETSLSGTDDNGLTLSYSDGAYVDVLLNGIELVAGTDYNTSTANTIAGLAALAASDVVTVTVYDIFTVADTVSAKDGGTFSSNVTFNGNINAGTIKDATGTNTGIAIDSSGRITKTNQPRFYAKMASDVVLTRATYTKVTGMTGNSIDVGNNFDGTEFVAPVAGDYYFSGSGWIDFNSAGVDGETVEMEIRKNSTAISVARFRNHTTKDLDDIVLKTDVIVTLAANDTIQLWVYSADNDGTGGSQTGKATLIGGNGTYLLGHLIG